LKKLGKEIFMIKRTVASLVTVGLLWALPLSAAGDSKESKRLWNCGMVLKEILDIPDDIPQDLIDKAECIIVYPSVLKAAFVVGGSYGRGAMTCRTGENFNGPWSAPSMMALEAGGIGFQIGGQATDFVLLVMNDRGAHSILSSKVKLGADAAVAAGPKGRNAQAATDVTLRAEILTYSRCLRAFRWKGRRCGPTTTPTSACTRRKWLRRTSFSRVQYPCRRRDGNWSLTSTSGRARARRRNRRRISLSPG
jgi:lipid-binding SYLF domain-containing protein